MPEYLYPGVYVEETDAPVRPIPGVSTSLDGAALESLAADVRLAMRTSVPGWTNYNESDPGVTLVEVFAFLAESLLYRSGELPERGRPFSLRASAALSALAGAPNPCIETVKRPIFFTGRLLDAATLAAEQEYHREKRRLHNLALLGSGVVSGLGVRVEPAGASATGRVFVEPGYAIDPRGEEVSLPCGATLVLPAAFEDAFVTLRFWEHACPPPAGPSVEEACVLAIVPEVAASALALARLVRAGGVWKVDTSFAPRRVKSGGAAP